MTDGAPGEAKLTTHTRDSAALAEQIAEWLSAKWGRPVQVSDVHAPTGSGMSSVTILFNADSPGHEPRRLVARLAPDEGRVALEQPMHPRLGCRQPHRQQDRPAAPIDAHIAACSSEQRDRRLA